MGLVESAELALVGSGFVGAYLHGSLAQGSFYPVTSGGNLLGRYPDRYQTDTIWAWL